MEKSEFDRFADEYRNLHQSNIKVSGETPDFFAEYKIKDTARTALDTFKTKNLDILDFGAGVGNSVPYFRKYFPDAGLTCLDVSTKSLALAEARFPTQAKYTPFDGKKIPFSVGQFDLVFSACVFHHIQNEEHEQLLSEIFRVLRPGGMLIIFEHNPYNPLTVHAVNTCEFDENAVLITAPAMMKRMRRVGFRKVLRRYRIFFPGSLRILRNLEHFLNWLPLGAQYYVAARKDLSS